MLLLVDRTHSDTSYPLLGKIGHTKALPASSTKSASKNCAFTCQSLTHNYTLSTKFTPLHLPGAANRSIPHSQNS